MGLEEDASASAPEDGSCGSYRWGAGGAGSRHKRDILEPEVSSNGACSVGKAKVRVKPLKRRIPEDMHCQHHS